jgi:putative transposase
MFAKWMANAAWNQLLQHIRYKAEGPGTVVSMGDPRGTSQTCPQRGAVKPKKLSQRS